VFRVSLSLLAPSGHGIDIRQSPPSSCEITDVGLPSNTDCVWHIVEEAEAFGKHWRDYRIEMIGLHVPDTGPHPAWPYWRLYPDDRSAPSVLIQIWRRRIYWRNHPVYLEALWHPERGRSVSIRGVEHATKIDDLKRAWQGAKLLHVVESKSGGRPEAPLHLEDVRRICQEFERESGRPVTPTELPGVLANACYLSESRMDDKLRILRKSSGLTTRQIIHGESYR